MGAFAQALRPQRRLLACEVGIVIEDFLGWPVEHWVK